MHEEPYASPAELREYTSLSGRSIPVGASDGELVAAIARSTGYLEYRYRFLWPGMRKDPAQVRAWPREGAFDGAGRLLSGVPREVVEAVCEGALAELGDPGCLCRSENGNGAVLQEREGGIMMRYARGIPEARQLQEVHARIQSVLEFESGLRIGRG